VIPDTKFWCPGHFCVGTDTHVDQKLATFRHVANVLPTCCQHSQLRCVANTITKPGKQLTVVRHVDDLMGSCEDDFELTKFSCYLASIHGTKLSMYTREKHNYLGMDMEFNNNGTLEVSMITYLKNIIQHFPEVINRKATSPAAEHLFMVRDDKEVKMLKKEQALAFYHTVAQLLFMSTRAQRDVQTAVAFLTTRVKNPDKDD
jgi:hypothetical protein